MEPQSSCSKEFGTLRAPINWKLMSPSGLEADSAKRFKAFSRYCMELSTPEESRVCGSQSLETSREAHFPLLGLKQTLSELFVVLP